MTTTLKHGWLLLVTLSAALCTVSAFSQTNLPPLPASFVQVTTIPAEGTFWSIQLDPYPPSPYDPLPDLNLYTPDGVNYFYDDRDFDYSTYWANQAAQSSSGGMFQADDSGPPSPGGTGSGTNAPSSFTLPNYADATCPGNFYLLISNSPSTSQVFVGITNALGGTVYNIFTNANLANSNGWTLQQSVTGSSSLTWAAPITITGTTNLFFEAQTFFRGADRLANIVMGDQLALFR
jgi:hypothetical protein